MVESEHLLLGIVKMGSGPALQILERLGVSILQLRGQPWHRFRPYPDNQSLHNQASLKLKQA